MGLDYGYELIAPRESADRLVRAFCDHLVPEDRTRVLASLRLGVPGMAEHVERDVFERQLFEHGGKELCLSFLFAEDEALAQYPNDIPLVDGRVQVGCVWTTIRCGSRFVLVRATAATTAMSLLFEQSANVRSTFREAGRAGGALLILFDDEREDFAAVWPDQGRFGHKAASERFVDEQCNLNIDDYCADLLASAHRTFAARRGDGH
jgi:hypothetical protein